MGRTGTLWAFEATGVIPDSHLLAIGFGGGLPLGAFIASYEMMQELAANPPLGHMTTFGGNALCCAASLETLNIILEENLQNNAQVQGEFIRTELVRHPAIREIRGKGLMLALELNEPVKLKTAIKACRENGLLVDWFLFNDRSIRIAPPLILTNEESKIISDKIIGALDSL